MGFLAPTALLLALLALPILLLYMLRLRREERVVSSTMLWQQILRDMEANTPWQRLRRNPLLLLQLIALSLLVIALARPYWATSSVGGDSLIVLLDASASMLATDTPPSRFDLAVHILRELIASKPAQQQITLIQVGPIPRVIVTGSEEGVLLQALDDLRPTHASASWEAALELAAAIARNRPSVTTLLITDGGLPDRPFSLPGEVQVRLVGEEGNNVAILAMALRDVHSSPQLFLRLYNADRVPHPVTLNFYADDVLIAVRRIDLPSQSEQSLLLGDLPLDLRTMEVRAEAEGDLLALDSVAWAVRPLTTPRHVYLFTRGNVFLENALRLYPTIELSQIPMTATLPADGALYVFDGVLPETLPDHGNLLFLNPPRDTEYFSVGEVFTETAVTRQALEHPLMHQADWRQVHIAQARKIEALWADRLVEAAAGPLLLAGEIQRRRIAIFSFDLHASDLPLQVAFPLTMANLMAWLSPSDAGVPLSLQPGEPLRFTPPPQLSDLSIELPSGDRHPLSLKDGEAIWEETNELGLYRVWSGDEEIARFAVNLFDRGEAEILPPDSPLEIVGIGETQQQVASTFGRREIWPWFVWLVVGVVLVEWIVAHPRMRLR